MSQQYECPACGKSLRVRDGAVAAYIKCPGCGKKFRAAGRPPREAREDAASKTEHPSGEDEEDLQPRGGRSRGRVRKASGNLQPFLGRWLAGLGVVLAIAFLIGIGGLFSQALALTACLICAAAALICLFVGTIWTAVDLGREHLPSGLAVLLIPAAGPALAFLKKGPALRGAVVTVSMVAPGLLLGLMLLVFYPKYASPRSSYAATAERLLHMIDTKVGPDTPVVNVTMRVASRDGELDGIQQECETYLAPFKHYVPGSLRIDAANRKISYQYRGDDQYFGTIAFYLSNKTGAFIPQQRVVEGQP